MTSEHEPQKDSDNSFDKLELIDKLCDRLRRELENGTPSPIKDLLLEVSESLRDELLEDLVAEEAQYRGMRGEQPRWDEYAERFGDRLLAAWKGFRHYEPDLTRPPELVGLNDEAKNNLPQRLGDYEVLAELGDGAFGRVFRARHVTSGDLVAIKQLKAEWAEVPDCRQQFLEEARRMMKFDHPGIVRVFELAEDAHPPFFVQELMNGPDLRQRLEEHQFHFDEATEIVIEIADALTHIHSRKLYHRDLKPANVLLDPAGRVHVADFGLALADAERWQEPKRPAGTFLYMPPEQLRGHWHLLNPRSDLWSLGVIYYELLTGERPFQENDPDKLTQVIFERVPLSPRDHKPQIPRTINRICMSCLEKEVRLRPRSAADLREELQDALVASPPPPPDDQDEIYPEPTLRCFRASEAKMYLRLMPHSYANKDELPELIHFWKERIACADPDDTFRIGMLVGVSGCGKSSLLEAGLLPKLPEHVKSVLVQATEADTEVQLLKALQKSIPASEVECDHGEPQTWSLPQWTRALREGTLLPAGHKALIVLDQFEQWLHAHGGDPVTQLRDALQQCDGEHLQAILCVREGFYSSLTRFVRLLGVSLDEERNYRTAHRFDIGHAKSVLEQFGRGMGALKGKRTEQEQEQVDEFLERAVGELAKTDQDGVRSVRLVVFAMVMAHRPWTIEELTKLGGLDWIGRQFLIDSFEGRTAPQHYGRLRDPAMRVLECLLPAVGPEIKDSRTFAQLLDASELSRHEFETLQEILVQKLFLVTPVDPDTGSIDETGEQPGKDEAPGNSEQRYYQLTHDFLVPSVRQWIEFIEERSPGGRARLLLRRLTGAWLADHENNRHLPSLPEYWQIRRRTEKKEWTEIEARLMKAAGSRNRWKIVIAAAIAAGLIFGVIGTTWQAIRATRQREVARNNHYAASIPLSYKDWQEGNLERMRDTLMEFLPEVDNPDLRGWEWYYLVSLIEKDENILYPRVGSANRVAWSPDGQLLAVGGNRGVKIYEPFSKQIVGAFDGTSPIAWHPKMPWLATQANRANGREVTIWNVQSRRAVQSIEVRGRGVHDIAWRPDGKALAWGGGKTFEVYREGEQASEVHAYSRENSPHGIGRLTWSPDGERLVLGVGFPAELFVWDDKISERPEVLELSTGTGIRTMRWNTSNGQLAIGTHNGRVHVWDMMQRAEVFSFRAHGGEVFAVAWSPDGTRFVTGGNDNLVKVWESRSHRLLQQFAGHWRAVRAVDWSPRGGLIASSGNAGDVHIWNAEENQEAMSLAGGHSAAWSPDGKKIVTGSGLLASGVDDDASTRRATIYDAESGNVLMRLEPAITSGVFHFAWSPDGNWIGAAIVAENSGPVYVWDAESGELVRRHPAAHYDAGMPWSQSRCIAWSPDSRLYATCGGDRRVKIWRTIDGERVRVRKDHEQAVGTVCWSPDGRWLLSADWDRCVKIWDTKTWELSTELTNEGKPSNSTGADAVYSSAWSPDSLRVATRSGAGDLVVWQLIPGGESRRVWSTRAHSSNIRSISWSPDGRRIATSSEDTRIKIWEAESGRELLAFHEAGWCLTVAWSPAGDRLLLAVRGDDRETRVRIWDARRAQAQWGER